MVFNLRHIPRRETPVIVTELGEVRKPVTFYSAGEIHIRIEITPRQIPEGSKQRLAAVQSNITRTANRAPQTAFLKNENHVIEQILRLDIQQQRRIAVLFQNHGCTDRGFKAVGFMPFYHFTERPKRATVALPVVGHGAEKSLHLRRLAKRFDQSPLSSGKRFSARYQAHRSRALADELWKGKKTALS